MSKGINLLCAKNDGMCTILQVTKCTGVPHQMLFTKGLSEFVLKSFPLVVSLISPGDISGF